MRPEDVLSRGVERILPSGNNLLELLKRKKIRLYLGIDPTGTKLHLGHTIPLRKLQQFADLGHEAILVIGTGTVLAGDPSQRETSRPRITEEEIEENMKTWKEQAEKIINFSKVKIMYNGDWLKKLTLPDIIEIASHISAVQLFKREMFQRRIDRGDTVWYHETLYPLLQGYDSVAMDVDLEIGGTDQEFNMLIGRELLQKMKGKEKYVLTVPMISGTDSKPMSKTSGNAVWLLDSPVEIFGKLMSMHDEQIILYMTLLTNMLLQEIQQIEQQLQSNELNPVEAKKRLAWEIVKLYHSEEQASKARDEFHAVFREGEGPTDAVVYKATTGNVNLITVLAETGMVQSNSDARRIINQGGVEWEGEKVTQEIINISGPGTLRIGKHRFLKIELQK